MQFDTPEILSAVGAGIPHVVTARNPAYLPPGVFVYVTSGAVLTYTIEATGDNTLAQGYFAASGNWMPLDPSVTGLTSSVNATLGACCGAVRLHITAYTSGSATIQVVSAPEWPA